VSAIPPPVLADGDLTLRPPAAGDIARITAICQDEAVQRYTRVPSPYTEEDAERFVEYAAEALRNDTGVHLVAVDTHDRVLGAIGLSIDRRDQSGEIGYWVAPEARRQGISVRGSRLLLRYAFDVLGLGYVMLWAAAENPASNGVARRLGFTHEGTSRDAMVLGPSGDASAPRGDAHLFGLRPGELT
jgi:RimJ/RimL family protein N-acetyltransferase